MMDRMDDLVQFLRARLDDDEQTAKAATWDEDISARWKAGCTSYQQSQPRPRWHVLDAYDDGVGGDVDEGVSRHIARHDPARVLAEVDAKRRIIDNYSATVRIRDEVAARIRDAGDNPAASDLDTWSRARYEAVVLEEPVRLLALPYADHPDYRDTWQP